MALRFPMFLSPGITNPSCLSPKARTRLEISVPGVSGMCRAHTNLGHLPCCASRQLRFVFPQNTSRYFCTASATNESESQTSKKNLRGITIFTSRRKSPGVLQGNAAEGDGKSGYRFVSLEFGERFMAEKESGRPSARGRWRGRGHGAPTS